MLTTSRGGRAVHEELGRGGVDACEAGHRAPTLFLDGRRLVPDLQDGRRALQAELRCSRQRACMPASYQSIRPGAPARLT